MIFVWLGLEVMRSTADAIDQPELAMKMDMFLQGSNNLNPVPYKGDGSYACDPSPADMWMSAPSCPGGAEGGCCEVTGTDVLPSMMADVDEFLVEHGDANPQGNTLAFNTWLLETRDATAESRFGAIMYGGLDGTSDMALAADQGAAGIEGASVELILDFAHHHHFCSPDGVPERIWTFHDPRRLLHRIVLQHSSVVIGTITESGA